MVQLSSDDLGRLLLAVGVLLALARILGELAQRIGQPGILGELLTGILLGPSILGSVAPRAHDYLFPASGPFALALDGLSNVGVVLFLLVAGMEVNLSAIWRQGKSALSVSISGIVIPFAIGFAAGWLSPSLLGADAEADRLVFALVLATTLSISALPVIARTLMDLNLYRSDLGMIIIAAAIFDDLAGWIIFAVVLGMMGSVGHGLSTNLTIMLTLLYVGIMLSVGRYLVHQALGWIQANTSWPGGVLAFSLSLAVFGAAFTQWIGVHAVFGSFVIGVVIGDSRHLREQTRMTISQFVSFVFAPLFFASIGLKVNVVTNFEPLLIVLVFTLSCFGKVVGCGLGARLGGMGRREACAVGFGMNARGVMGIILGLLALQNHVISEAMFVAIVIMSVVTSMIAGPAMRVVLRLRKRRQLADYITSKSFAGWLKPTDRREAIEALCGVAAGNGISVDVILQAVLAREGTMPTGIGNGVAIPHARIEGLQSPILVLGLSAAGIDFDAPDGEPSHVIILILSPTNDDGVQLQILADIARTFSSPAARREFLKVNTYTELLATLRSTADIHE